MKHKLTNSVEAVAGWVEAHHYRAYDPGDGQLSFVRHFFFNNLFMERLLTAGVLRTPFNIRPLLGIPRHTSTKGMGYMAWGYVRRYKLTGDERLASRAIACLDWLMEHRALSCSEYCWGNHFTFTTRAGRLPRYEPTIVWSSLIGQAFVDAYEALGNERYLQVASSICDWVLKLPREKTGNGNCLSYVPYTQSSIHNSNMLGAGLLARVGKLTGRSDVFEPAREAMLYSCSRQNPDGAWFYGEHPKYHWIDNFHTGYNLDSLKRYIDNTGDTDFKPQLLRGYDYFKKNFFEADGLPKYYHNKAYPVDIQCAAQAIDTLAFFSNDDPEALALACRVADWTIDNMQAPDGHFYYRNLGWKTIKTPMFHWGQGTMFKALAHLLDRMTHTASAATRA
jgi:rhamnogalacturonyl hydrolase YesR